MRKKSKHDELQNIAIGWLYSNGCSVFAKEVPTRNGIADALGIRTRDKNHTVYYIEAKASRSDLICQKQRCVYARSAGFEYEEFCVLHQINKFTLTIGDYKSCKECKKVTREAQDTGIDFYYFILADGVKIEEDRYVGWGVINESGRVVRRAKRMKRERDTIDLIENIAHVLVYKVFGKMYSI